MEGVNQKGSSTNNEALGAKGSSSEANSSTSNLFSLLFPPPTKDPFHFLEPLSKRNSANQTPKTEASTYGENGSRGMPEKPIDSYFREEKSQPFNYDSSIYYGGQDVLIQPSNNAHNSNATRFKQDGEDDENMASRGNWWQGSLYY